MGDLECGFEEMQGVKLGYLLIKGKQMFALSQVFTDLLKNIPRTTVHKRMDHLNVKKHHCDLEELRKLKSINSIAFHAAKCTLISREDVEALYFSCKTQRVLKSNKRKVKASPPGDAREGQLHQDKHVRLWKEKVWFSLHSVPQTLPLNNKAGRELPQLPDSNLPQIYIKKHNQEYSSVSKSNCKPFKNYETAQITGNCVAINQRQAFFRSVVSRQPVLFQSAIAAQPNLSSAASDLLHKRKRRREGGGGRDSARQLWSRSSRHTHHPPVLIVQPKCCSKTKRPRNETLGTFQIGHEFYLDPGPQQSFQESCSSDTESSSFSEQVNNDSDFGSSLSTSSNSGTSDEEDDSPSESSEVSSDEESSSQSESSSVSSQVSVQSIRFRRARFNTKSLNTKAPLVLQPTFHYSHRNTPEQRGKAEVDYYDMHMKHARYDSTNREAKQNTQAEVDCDPKRADPANSIFYAQGLSPCPGRSKVLPTNRTLGHAGKCSPGLCSHYAHVKDKKHFKSNDFSLAINLKKETKNCPGVRLPSPLKSIKSEAEESLISLGPLSESVNATKTPPFVLQNVKIKVEECYDEYEYSNETPGFQCKGDDADINNAQYPSGDIKHADYFSSNTTKAIESSAGAPKSPTRSQECRSTEGTPCPEEGEYKNGARVRKNYRTLVLGRKKTGISRTQHKQNVSNVDNTLYSRPTDKEENCEGYTEDVSGASKRKRAFGNVASSIKKPFSFMANFPSPPSLVVGSDGDLSPAYSLNSLRDPQPPPRSHPVWSWQPGGLPVPPPPAQKFRKC